MLCDAWFCRLVHAIDDNPQGKDNVSIWHALWWLDDIQNLRIEQAVVMVVLYLLLLGKQACTLKYACSVHQTNRALDA